MPPPQTPAAAQPMEADVYAAYQAALDILNQQCESTMDPIAQQVLNDAAQPLSEMLTKENIAEMQAHAAAFTALTPQMCKSNDALKKLKDQIADIASKIADVGKVMGAIEGVLELTAKFA